MIKLALVSGWLMASFSCCGQHAFFELLSNYLVCVLARTFIISELLWTFGFLQFGQSHPGSALVFICIKFLNVIRVAIQCILPLPVRVVSTIVSALVVESSFVKHGTAIDHGKAMSP